MNVGWRPQTRLHWTKVLGALHCAGCTLVTVSTVQGVHWAGVHWAHDTTFCSVAHKCTQVHTIAHSVDCIFKLNCTDIKIQCCIHLA